MLEPAVGSEPARTVSELNLDFEKLTGGDFEMCDRESLSENANVPAIDPRLSPVFQAHVASRACGIPVETLRRLGLRDYGEMVTAVRDFFVGEG